MAWTLEPSADGSSSLSTGSNSVGRKEGGVTVDDAWHHPLRYGPFKKGKNICCRLYIERCLNLTQPWGEGMPGPWGDIPAGEEQKKFGTDPLNLQDRNARSGSPPARLVDSLMPGTLASPGETDTHTSAGAQQGRGGIAGVCAPRLQPLRSALWRVRG